MSIILELERRINIDFFDLYTDDEIVILEYFDGRIGYVHEDQGEGREVEMFDNVVALEEETGVDVSKIGELNPSSEYVNTFLVNNPDVAKIHYHSPFHDS
jgi:hypothetical protein